MMGFLAREIAGLKQLFGFEKARLKDQELRPVWTIDQPTNIDEPGGSKRPSQLPQPGWEKRLSTWGGNWLEWLVIFLVVSLFCAGILDLGSATRLPGNESETFQMLDWTLVNSLKQYHAFPLWNTNIQSGLPYIADPMLHVYNPVVSVPVLLFGVRVGFKLAVYFSFMIAAFGMWRLAHTLGMGRVARLWTALMFAFAGQPVARFFQGQYLFIFGFAFIPWIISSLILVIQSRRRREVAIAAASLALLFFSGNAYYPLYILLIIGLFGLVMLITVKKKAPFIFLQPQHTFAFLSVGVLVLGLVAIQLLPTAEFWPRLNKDLKLAGSHTLEQIFLDYTSKDISRADAYSVLPAREEFYAYVGFTPFLGLALLPLAIWKRERRIILFFVLILLLVVGWVSLEWMPWKQLFLNTRLFLQFRHLLRILIFGSFALICLAGIGLDTLWKLFTEQSKLGGWDHSREIRWLSYAGLAILGAFMFYGVADLFATNQPLVRTQDVYQPAYEVMSWVKQNDPSDYYVRHNANNLWQEAVVSNNLRYLDTWYHFADIRALGGKINQRYVQAGPNYLTQPSSEPAPDGAELLATVDGYNIFRLPASLPMAFTVVNDRLQLGNEAGRLVRSEVTAQTTNFTSSSKVEVVTTGSPDQTLVLLMTRYPGWQVLVDGKAQTLENVSGYMAVAVQPGTHQYTFVYTPRSFFIGLVISVLTSVIVLGLYLSDVQVSRQTVRENWQSSLERVKQASSRIAEWLITVRQKTNRATYQRGALQPSELVAIGESSPLPGVTVPQAGLGHAWAAWRNSVRATPSLVRTVWRSIPFEMALFTLALGLYLSTRLIGLAQFPIYFFTDEAVQTVMAEDFVHSSLRNYEGDVLPTYFNISPSYNLSSVSVYLQVIPYLIFGKSIFVTRAVSVLIATLGALAVGLILRDIFKLRYWWCGVLLLSIAPAWFLHSRTAFETVEMASFYAGFLYFYLRYRYISPKALYPALVMGALVFYTYSPGQLIILVTGSFLLLSDLRYHWQNRKIALGGLLLLALLSLPYLRYALTHTDALMRHLSTRASYWAQDIPLFEKLSNYFSNYAYGLSPQYWFIPNQHDLDRHLMKGYGHLLLATLPFFALGLSIILIRVRSSAHRAVLLAMLAAPSGAALVGIGITRILVFIIPATLAMALGLDLVLGWLDRGVKWILKRRGIDQEGKGVFIGISIMAMVALGITNIAMLRDALLNGPTWYQDYTLAGMQYGASQLFGEVNEYLHLHPEAELMVSPSWTNGADVVAKFFLPPKARVVLGSIEGYLYHYLPMNDNLTFVMIPTELEKVVSSGKFSDVRVEKVLPYPNGAPGFYFVQLRYVDNIDQILAIEQEQRSLLQETTLMIQGEPVHVTYSMLDMGSIDLLFDGDRNTVARTMEANPFVIELTFSEARRLDGYKMELGSVDAQVTTLLYPQGDRQPLDSVADFKGSMSNPIMDVDFSESVSVQKVRFEILQPNSGVPANVHVWEIELK